MDENFLRCLTVEQRVNTLVSRMTMPKVVADQRDKFETDELFRKLCREAEIKYAAYRERAHEERKAKLQADVREGHADIAYVSSGTNFQLYFLSNPWSDNPDDKIPTKEYVDFEREPGKVHLKSHFILNGVCVIWKGWLDLHRLDGAGYLEYDQERAMVEDTLMRQQYDMYHRRVQDFDDRHDRQKQYREGRQGDSEKSLWHARPTRTLDIW